MSLLAEVALIWHILLGLFLFLTSGFLIMLVMVQRGRGGGLAGALGGMGGQSAFGTKAGDVFTRITVITAIIWIILCIVTLQAFREPKLVPADDSAQQQEDLDAESRTPSLLNPNPDEEEGGDDSGGGANGASGGAGDTDSGN